MQILLQNKDFIAVVKPAGLSVHNIEDPQNLLTVLEKQLNIKKLYPVHRLDKETSGVQILALHDAAAKNLAGEFQSQRVTKIYQGVLRGLLSPQEGIWRQPLSDKSEGRKNPAGLSKDRVPCETRFQVLKTNKYFSLCEFHLITGRQHQIRKHAALMRNALVGDPRYGDQKYNQKIAELYNESRMFLHCVRVEISGVRLECETPKSFFTLAEAKSSFDQV